MAESTKPVRLSKAAREFNLGIATVVDFLASKGIEVEANPNTKLDPDTYALVRNNFQGDKEIKQKAQRTAASVTERESITLASAKKRVKQGEVQEEPEIDLSQFRKSEAAPVVERSTPKETAPEPAKVEAPAAEKQEAPKAEQAPEPETSGPKVVGKVDLDALKPKTAAKAEPVKEETKEPAKAEEAAPAKEEALPRRLPKNRKWFAPKPRSSVALLWWGKLNCRSRRRKRQERLGRMASASACVSRRWTCRKQGAWQPHSRHPGTQKRAQEGGQPRRHPEGNSRHARQVERRQEVQVFQAPPPEARRHSATTRGKQPPVAA